MKKPSPEKLDVERLAMHAEFNPLIRPYLVVSIGFTLLASIVGIPFALIWFCGVGQWWARHYFDKLECELDEAVLRFRKGILVQVEKTIPLENIQDVTFIEGPILRHFNLAVLKFETAGSSAEQSNQMRLTGIIDAAGFRRRILQSRDRLKHPPKLAPNADDGRDAERLDQQAALLAQISGQLGEILQLLRADRNKNAAP